MKLFERLGFIGCFCGGFVLLGLLFFGLSYLGENETRAFLKTAKAAKGTVVGHITETEKVEREKSSTKYYTYYRPSIQFADETGKEFKFKSLQRWDEPTPAVGHVYDIYYAPANPEYARINSADELYYSAQGLNGASIFCFGFALVVWIANFINNRMKAKKPVLTGEAARRAYYGEPD
jgi:hypothetical protein